MLGLLQRRKSMADTRKATGLVAFCETKLGTPYVYGAKGEILTEERLKTLKKQNPSMYSSKYLAKARKFIGQRCTDCSGLISWYTGVIRGSYNFHDTATEKVPIGALDESMIGWALWKPGHIGVYVGNGYCIEAKGIDYGTIKSRVKDTAWQKVLKLKDIDYSVEPVYTEGFKRAADGKCWWYQYEDGSYATNGWYWLTEATGGTSGWYLFDAEGYMLTGYQKDPAGQYFFLCPDKGIHEGQCMIADERGALYIAEKYDFENHRYL